MTDPDSPLTGLVLAAGAGTRMGRAKALMATDGEPWLQRAIRLLESAGCERVLVVLGASAEDAAPMIGDDAHVTTIVAERWREGMSASLRAGLVAITAETPDAVAALITLVDLPELPASVAQRVVAIGAERTTVRQATFAGRPGHPVLIGRAHWAAICADVEGDHGARRYLVEHGVEEVECGDLYDGHDEDVAADSPTER